LGGRSQPSSIDKLPEEVRAAIGRLRVQGRTLDEILAHLNALDVDVSRSALARHVKKMATLTERMNSARNIAVALVDRFGDQPDNKLARLNLELMQSVVMQTITAAVIDEETGEAEPVTFQPEDVAFLARALKELASAQKTDSDRTIIVQREVLKRAATAVKDSAGEAGLSDATADFIMKKVLGVAK